ncbi:serine/threonine protein kinase [Minicystis rosea]|nr:serine/threonine protein kinase [Minicystis rosea]
MEPRVVGRYALYGEIAAGGMATVHLGRLLGPVGFSRTIAIKRLHPSYARDPEFVSMFLDEARLAARIRHPNVVPTLDVVATQGELFLVMEYIQGESLAHVIKAAARLGQRIPSRIALSILAGALQGLHAAHEARDERGMSLGLVHRDVSPQNILIGVDGMARVLDFGVAKAAGRAQSTREGVLKGKLGYMAPEQIHQEPIGRAADIHAAAVVLWEALVGARLFRGGSEAELLACVLAHDVQPPSTRVPDVPSEVDAIVMRGLAKSPGDRFATARDMALALDRCGSASLGEVAEWLESVVGSSLAKRAAEVSEVEARSAVTDASLHVAASGDDAPSAPASTPTRAAAAPTSPDVGLSPDTGLSPDVMPSLSVHVPIAGEARRQRIQLGVTAALLAIAALGGAAVALSVTRGAAANGVAAPSAAVASSAAPSVAPPPMSALPTASVAPEPAMSAPPAASAVPEPRPTAPIASAKFPLAPSGPRKAAPRPAQGPKSPFDLGGRD